MYVACDALVAVDGHDLVGEGALGALGVRSSTSHPGPGS